jgi:hypothetical protein
MATGMPRAEAETEATLAVPATSVTPAFAEASADKPRAAIESVGVGLVGELFPQPTAASPKKTDRPRLAVVRVHECGRRIVLSV